MKGINVYMRNDAQVKVTWLTDNQKMDEIHFDYYDKDGIIVGTVAVDALGKLGWSIWNEKYLYNILYTVSSIFGLNVDNSIEYILEAKKNDSQRFSRARRYIAANGLIVNYIESIPFSEEFKNSFTK